jgi:hypothetical protein
MKGRQAADPPPKEPQMTQAATIPAAASIPAPLIPRGPVAAPAQVRSKMDAAIGSEGLQNSLGYLHSRWSDEREYEDFKDYGPHIEKAVVAQGLEFVRATKRPFGAIVRVEGFSYQIGVNSSSIYYKRA